MAASVSPKPVHFKRSCWGVARELVGTFEEGCLLMEPAVGSSTNSLKENRNKNQCPNPSRKRPPAHLAPGTHHVSLRDSKFPTRYDFIPLPSRGALSESYSFEGNWEDAGIPARLQEPQ